MFKMTQRGAEDVVSHLNRIQSGMNQLDNPMKQALLYVHSQVPGYPPPPATSSYRRTGTLGRSVTTMGSASGPALSRVEGHGANVIGYIGSGITYAPYVIDEARQAFMHRGRWWTLQSVVLKSASGVAQIFKRYIEGLY